MTRRDAFARAKAFLDFLPLAKFSAIAAGVASGLFCLVLLVLLAFLADLIIYQGRLPSFDDLSGREREQLWAAPLEQKQQWLEAAGHEPSYAQRILEGGSVSYSRQREIVWQAFVADLLRRRVNDEAASRFLEAVSVARVDRDSDRFGMLGMVVRCRDQWLGVPLGWLARRAPGLWQVSGDQANLVYLSRLGVLIGVAFLLLAGCELIAGLASIRTAGEAGTRLRRAVYQHTFRRGSLAIRAQGPAEAVSVLTRHVEAVQDGLLAWLATLGRPILILLVFAFMLAISPWLGSALLLLGLLALGLAARLAQARARRDQTTIQKAAQQLALMQESLRLLRLVKCYLMDLFSQQRMDRQLASYARYDQKRRKLEALTRTALLFIIGLAGIAWLGFAAWLVLTQRQDVVQALTAGAAGAALFLAGWDLRRRQPEIVRGRLSAEALFEFLDQPSDVTQDIGADTLPPMAQQLELDHVSMREPGGSRMLLEDVSLRLPAGRKLGIVGPEDREKHALACLLPRFVDPSSGEIRIDEHNLRWVSLESLRGQIGLVLRHNLIFNDTVLQNIGCGALGAKLPQITEAAKLAHAHHFIQKLPKGYDTPIGELGYPLDLGEQFRIALARAILRQPTLLVIEEPLATDLDTDTLSLLDDTYNRILAGRTVVFLPHRLATLRTCDHLILLHQGRIEAAGTHRDLLAGNEYYQHLHYLEFNPYGEAP